MKVSDLPYIWTHQSQKMLDFLPVLQLSEDGKVVRL